MKKPDQPKLIFSEQAKSPNSALESNVKLNLSS